MDNNRIQQTISKEMKDKISNALYEKGAVQHCPRCNHATFSLADGYVMQQLQGTLGGFTIGGRAIPCVAVICEHCGYVNFHAIGPLGLMEEAGNDEK